MTDYYAMLGVSKNATLAEITSAYKKRMKVVHPDRFDARTQPDEWQQANRMLQELNGAYEFLKKNHEANYTESEATRNYTSQKQEERKSSSDNGAYKQELKGITHCLSKNLSLAQVHFINSLINNKISSIKIGGYSIYFSYPILAVTLYFYISNFINWMSLGSVSQDSFALGIICLLILCVILAKCSSDIYLYHTAKVKPCVVFTPLYFIRVRHRSLSYSYIWEITSIKYIVNKYTAYITVTVGTHVEKFYVPRYFNFSKFKEKLKVLDNTRMTDSYQLNGMQIDDILRNQKLSLLPSLKSVKIVNYATSVIITIIVSFVLGNTLTVIDYTTTKTQNIENYASKETNRPTIEESTTNQKFISNQVKFSQPAKPLPENGKLFNYEGSKGIAPLEIIVPNHGDNYFVKVVDAFTNKNVKAVFVRSGHKVKIKVPLGTYKVKYATGTTWYGREYLFGPDTIATIADKDFIFERYEDHVSGFTIELIKQVNGNLKSKGINLNDF